MFKNPYVFGSLVVALTALLVFVYQYTVEPERGDANKRLAYKTLAAGALSVFAIGWVIHRQEPVLTDPFPIDG